MSIGRLFTAVLISTGVVVIFSGVANAAPRAAAPALDAQAVNGAQLPAPSKGRPPAPSAATLIKAEVLLGRAGFSPGAIDGKVDVNYKKALAAFQDATESSSAAVSTPKRGSA